MVRRTIEGTCRDQGVDERFMKKNSLEVALNKLHAAGKVDSSLAAWAKELRQLGNEGAHFSGRPMHRQDAEDALMFVEALLDQLYVLRKRFNDFTARRASASATAAVLPPDVPAADGPPF